MTTEGRCSFHKNCGSSGMGLKRGSCLFDRAHTVCGGEIKQCEKLDALRQYLMKRNWMKCEDKNEKTWGRNGNLQKMIRDGTGVSI